MPISERDFSGVVSGDQKRAAEPLCTVVVTTYARSDLALGCVRRLQALLPSSVPIIVSDDGSDEEHRNVLAEIGGVHLLLAEKNRGLGANINGALAAVRTPYALWVQDDMWLSDDIDGEFLSDAIAVLESCPSIDIVRVLVPYRLAEAEHVIVGSRRVKVFSRSILRNGFRFASVYSDNPHVRRVDLIDRIGPYREMGGHGNTETEYAFRCLREKVGVAAVEGFDRVFYHVGDDRSTQGIGAGKWSRRRWRTAARGSKLLIAYAVYRLSGRFPDGLYRSRLRRDEGTRM